MQIGQQDIARRYARAFFALAGEQGQVEFIAADLRILGGMLAESTDFNRFINDVTVGRDVQAKAIAALASRAGLSALTQKLLGTLAMKRRLALLPVIVAEAEAMVDAAHGVARAEVTTAQALDAAQADAIKAALKKSLGTEVKVAFRQDPDIMGGLIVKIGSRQIDSSVQAKLQRLHRALKNSNTDKTKKEVA